MFNNYFVEYQMGRKKKKDQARFHEAFWKIGKKVRFLENDLH